MAESTKAAELEGSSSNQAEYQERALAELVVLHQVGVWRYLRALGAEADLADDITQETFLEIMRRPLQQFSDASTASYLRRVAHNFFITRRRRDKRMTLTDQFQAFEDVWVQWAGADSGDSAIDALSDCLQRITERARVALRMRFADNASRAEIAAALQISEHGAKNLMQRAKGQLRECVEQKLK